MNNMSKICFSVAHPSYNIGGAEYQAYLLSKHLLKYFDIFFISSRVMNDKFRIDYDSNGLKIYSLKERVNGYIGRYRLINYKLISDILLKEQPELLYHRCLQAQLGLYTRYANNNPLK